jgi:hypothetical protein
VKGEGFKVYVFPVPRRTLSRYGCAARNFHDEGAPRVQG